MRYKPDIHVYLDTSGSIDEENYRSAIMTCIYMARKLNVNLYFNSFSHVISQCAHLRTRGLSTQNVYNAFQKLPKVSGGTDYAQIWNYINASPKRRKEISLMITDFEYEPPSERFEHPAKLWYIPIEITKEAWPEMVSHAEEFCQAMFHIDGNIRQKCLM